MTRICINHQIKTHSNFNFLLRSFLNKMFDFKQQQQETFLFFVHFRFRFGIKFWVYAFGSRQLVSPAHYSSLAKCNLNVENYLRECQMQCQHKLKRTHSKLCVQLISTSAASIKEVHWTKKNNIFFNKDAIGALRMNIRQLSLWLLCLCISFVLSVALFAFSFSCSWCILFIFCLVFLFYGLERPAATNNTRTPLRSKNWIMRDTIAFQFRLDAYNPRDIKFQADKSAQGLVIAEQERAEMKGEITTKTWKSSRSRTLRMINQTPISQYKFEVHSSVSKLSETWLVVTCSSDKISNCHRTMNIFFFFFYFFAVGNYGLPKQRYRVSLQDVLSAVANKREPSKVGTVRGAVSPRTPSRPWNRKLSVGRRLNKCTSLTSRLIAKALSNCRFDFFRFNNSWLPPKPSTCCSFRILFGRMNSNNCHLQVATKSSPPWIHKYVNKSPL